LDADRTGHEVLADDAEVREALRQRWGDSVFTRDGSVDRAALARSVFSSGEAGGDNRSFLEALLHRRIRRRLEKLRDQYAAEGRTAVVLDAPLLLEAGWGPICDLLIMVDAPRAFRLARAAERGWSEAELARREAAQWPVDDKRREADLVVANDGSEAELRNAVRGVWEHHVVR
jgi:dephospho-CoA kinase